MASQIIVTKGFRQNVVETCEYISNTFSSKTASLFLDRIERRIDFIAAHPEAGKPSRKRKMYAAFYYHRTIKSITVSRMKE